MRALALIVALGVAIGVAFHPSRPLYMTQRAVEFTADDGVTLRGTLSMPRWQRGPFPAIVLVHGSGPLTREMLLGDTRQLVRLGFAVLAYDKRGAGASGGTYQPGATTPAPVLLRRLALDAAAGFDSLAKAHDVDTTRIGFLGASQAGWVIPLASEMTRIRPSFAVLLSGNAVTSGVEHYYSDLTGDGTRAPTVTDRSEVERLTLAFNGAPGFDPVPHLATTRVPTLWLLGDRDESGPTFATVRVLDSLRSAGNDRHTVIRYPTANHALRDVTTGEPAPLWDDLMAWLGRLRIVARAP